MTTISEVVAASAWLFCLPPSAVLGRRRYRRYLRARYAVYMALRRRGNTYGQIGRWLGRDHTTIMNGVEVGNQWALEDKGFAEAVKKLENMGRSPMKEGNEENGSKEVECGAPGCPEVAGEQADRQHR